MLIIATHILVSLVVVRLTPTAIQNKYFFRAYLYIIDILKFRAKKSLILPSTRKIKEGEETSK